MLVAAAAAAAARDAACARRIVAACWMAACCRAPVVWLPSPWRRSSAVGRGHPRAATSDGRHGATRARTRAATPAPEE